MSKEGRKEARKEGPVLYTRLGKPSSMRIYDREGGRGSTDREGLDYVLMYYTVGTVPSS